MRPDGKNSTASVSMPSGEGVEGSPIISHSKKSL